MRRMINRKTGIIAVIVIALAFFLSGCSESPDTGQDKENKAKIDNYNLVVEKQPNPIMDYSPTRNTIIKWGDYWKVPGRLAYTYITDGPNDKKGGYYVFVGPPVSYCVGLTNPMQLKDGVDLGDTKGEVLVPAPGIDSVYGGGDCSQFYGIDAVSKMPVAFSVGMGQNMMYFAQPNQRYDAEPLGEATFETAKKKG